MIAHQLSTTGEASAKAAQLVLLAAVQRYALAVLAEAHQIETEIRLVSLLVEVQRDERLADLVREPGADDRVDDRHPDHIAVDHIASSPPSGISMGPDSTQRIPTKETSVTRH